MKIACTNGMVAAKVRAALAGYGIVRGVHRIGPYVDGPMVWLLIKVAVEPADVRRIRHEVESIAGATIVNVSAA